jgi:4-hydroxy-tetrahydrodipicolinate synthase
MASDFRPTGVFVPLVTPFDEGDRIDLEALHSLASQVLDEGAAGVVALATTGEPTSLDDAEREAVVEVCADVCGE